MIADPVLTELRHPNRHRLVTSEHPASVARQPEWCPSGAEQGIFEE
jgi:hypothetical protein